MKTLLVTGGTGFFGMSILDAFRCGLLAPFGVGRIIAMARTASRLRNTCPSLCGPGVEFIDSDVLDMTTTADAALVIHAAASSDAQRYRQDPQGETRVIVDGTRRVCAAIQASRRRPPLLYVSSGAVYGRQPTDVTALREDAPHVAESDSVKYTYMQAKRAAEAVIREWAAAGRPARIARCFTFVGPCLPREKHFAIGNFIGNALRGEPIEVKASHSVIRSYLHADDLAVWLMTLVTAHGAGSDIVNVGSDEAVSIRDLASLVARLAGVNVRLPDLPAAAAAAWSTDRYVPDISKARREYGLTVTIPLREAIERTLRSLGTKIANPALAAVGTPVPDSA